MAPRNPSGADLTNAQAVARRILTPKARRENQRG
jgi:hypothetical protein